MLVSLRFGSNDVAKSRSFYDAIFSALGGDRSILPDGAPMAMYRLPGGLMFLVGPAADGEPATHANGGTILLSADHEAAVDSWHAAGIKNGGACEGPPGPRPRAGDRYGAYLRDPDGNKLGCYVGSVFG